jgi:hypothetical protein
MRDVGRSKILLGWAGLCAMGACTTVPHPSVESRPAVSLESCALVEPLSAEGSDTARILFTASGLTRQACALRLASIAFRPWSAPSHAHWTVHVVLDDTGATIRPLGREDARDMLDTARTLVATEDLALVAYVAARPELEVVPLPWDRTYVHLSRAASAALGAQSFSDAVRVDARPAQLSPCDTISASSHAPATESSSRVVHEAGDRTARDLAERVVALTHASAAAALDRAEFERALRRGNELAYILSVPRSSDDGCDVEQALRLRAEWIATGSIHPLIDTRAYAVMPRDSSP